MNKTEFTAYKLASIDRAAADQRLTDLGFRLLWLIASAGRLANRRHPAAHANRTGRAASVAPGARYRSTATIWCALLSGTDRPKTRKICHPLQGS